MAKVTVWVCSEDETHVFKEPTDDFFCHIGVDYHGLLVKKIIDDDEDPFPPPPPPPPPPVPVTEVGLCVILMDASSSMTEPPFESTPLPRTNLIATSAAKGIFDLERMQNNNNAYIAAFKFDHRVEPMFVDSVANLLDRFNKDVKTFAGYINDELLKMQGGTDINKALQQAYSFVDKFIKKQLPDFPVKDYAPVEQVIWTNAGESVSIPNIRVLIYTDGMQFDEFKKRILNDNPFKQKPLPGLNHDIVIGAFLGNETDDGCKELKGLLSNCPVHDVKQFFLINNPTQLGILKNLFRMASGASGFCPVCLEKKLYR